MQWARARADGTLRAVQVGLLSRGISSAGRKNDTTAAEEEACYPQKASSAAAVYSKLAARRAWIMAHAADGGCAHYY